MLLMLVEIFDGLQWRYADVFVCDHYFQRSTDALFVGISGESVGGDEVPHEALYTVWQMAAVGYERQVETP